MTRASYAHACSWRNRVSRTSSTTSTTIRADQPGRWVFGRLAVLPEARRGGFWAALLAESERLAREAGATEMHLHAQCRVTPFYGRMGYAQYGPVELDEHVEHIWMEKLLDETGGRG